MHFVLHEERHVLLSSQNLISVDAFEIGRCGDEYIVDGQNLSVKADSYSYTGPIQHGKFNGQGTLKTRAGTYEGNFRAGQKQGFGKFVFDDFESGGAQRKGWIVQGDWKNDKPSGRMALTPSGGAVKNVTVKDDGSFSAGGGGGMCGGGGGGGGIGDLPKTFFQV